MWGGSTKIRVLNRSWTVLDQVCTAWASCSSLSRAMPSDRRASDPTFVKLGRDVGGGGDGLKRHAQGALRNACAAAVVASALPPAAFPSI